MGAIARFQAYARPSAAGTCLAFGANTPWKRIRCSRARGTSVGQALHGTRLLPRASPGHWPGAAIRTHGVHVAFNMSEHKVSEQPTASINCCYTASGLPIGLQVVGKPFDNLGLLQLVRSVERRRLAQCAWPEPYEHLSNNSLRLYRPAPRLARSFATCRSVPDGQIHERPQFFQK